ncbi:MAG: amidohydrolase family protein [Lachnospiraceae bacterium]|nr:amidohydrolase family protein [Lachnospiraceae bacterium]
MIDFHTHIWPDRLAPGTIKALSAAAGIPARTDGTAEGLRRSMADSGIALSVVLPVITRTEQFDSITGFASTINEKYEDLVSFGAVFPGDPDHKERLRILKEYGFKGIKIHPDYHRVALDAKESMDIIYEASALGMIISVHAGIDIGLPDHPCSTPEMAAKVLDEIGPEKLVLAHTGGWKLWDETEELLAGRDVYFDLSFTDGYIRDEQWERIIKKHGAKRCLFGTDSPWSGQKETTEALRRLDLTDEECRLILYENASGLLGG